MCKRRRYSRRREILEEILLKVQQPLINVTVYQGSYGNESKENSEKSENVTIIVDKNVRVLSKL